MKTRNLLLCALFAALTAVSVFLPKVPIPGTPLMFTFQTFFVFLAGLLLQPRYALISQLVYMALGLIGLPVFMSGGGLSYVLEPSFGFVIGFAVCAFLTSLLVRKQLVLSGKTQGRAKTAAVLKAALFAAVSLIAMYVIAIIYMYLIYSLYLDKSTTLIVIAINMVVFILIDSVKYILAGLIGTAVLRRLTGLNGTNVV
ncbi:MAG: biotin transporter BioY [Pseudoflavonifractor sp.]|nr:biotin transporter BioY [Pseudoflavonifractor sp.]